MEKITQDKLDKFLTAPDNQKYIFNDSKIDLVKNPCFKDVYVVNSLHQYVEFINILLLSKYRRKKKVNGEKKTVFIRDKVYFRGVSKVEQLVPTLWRGADKANKDREYEYISKFEENASLLIGQFNNPIDLAAAAQHYGTNTRLLDWTHSPYIATLFSLFDVLKNNNNYYGLVFRDQDTTFTLKDLPLGEKSGESMSAKYYSTIQELQSLLSEIGKIPREKRNIFLRSHKEDLLDEKKRELIFSNGENNILRKIIDYSELIVNNTHPGIGKDDVDAKKIKIARAIIDDKRELFIETNYSNERLRNQRGVFQICFDDYDPFYGNSLLLIHPRARIEIIKYINRLGFNYYMLMNDPENAGKLINKTLIKEISFDDEVDYLETDKKKFLPIMKRN